MQAPIFDVTAQDFQSVIAQGSVEQPVLVIFWSMQCTICQTLLPVLEQLQREHSNRFTLARINCDKNEALVKHFDIQSVPTIYMYVNGQAVDGFAGQQSTDLINEFIKKHLPDPAVALLHDAQTLFAQGKVLEAKATIVQAHHLSPNDSGIVLAYAQILLGLGEFENAKPLLESVPMADQNMIYHNLISELQLAEQASQTPEISALETQLSTSVDKRPVQYKLAIQYHQAKRFKEALHLLYGILVADLGYEDGEAKKTMLDILATMDDPALTSEYRRKLYSLLY